jgi:hypothetical protein
VDVGGGEFGGVEGGLDAWVILCGRLFLVCDGFLVTSMFGMYSLNSLFRRRPEPSGVSSWFLPGCFRDLAAYAAGVSLACRRASHFLFAGPRLRAAHANGEAGPEGEGPLGPE